VIFGPPILGVREDIVDVHDAMLQDGSPRRRTSILTDRIPLCDFDKFSRVTVAGRNAIDIPVLLVDEAPVGTAKADRLLHQAFQHWLKVESRATNNLEDL